MQAAILAAGLGTRLRPLTLSTPKALVPVLNRPLLGLWLLQLQRAGCSRVAVNTHHLSDQVHQFVETHKPPGLEVILRPEPELLGTGGGLGSLAAALKEEPFLAANVDVLTDLDLAGLWAGHEREALATLVLHDFPPLNRVWLSLEGEVLDIGGKPRQSPAQALAYTGIQLVSPQLRKWLPAEGYADLVNIWRRIISQGGLLKGKVVSGHFWQDLGTLDGYLAAHRRLLSGVPLALASWFPEVQDPLLGEGTVVAPGVTFAGGVCLGREVTVGEGAWLKNTVVWDQAEISPKVRLENCVVGRRAKVTANRRGELII